MKKKGFALFFTIGLAVCFVACGKNGPETQDSLTEQQTIESQTIEEAPFDEEAFLKETTVEVTDALAELISCDAYLDVMSAAQELNQVIEGWRGLKIDQSQPIHVIPLNLSDTETYLKSLAGEDLPLDQMPQTVKEYLLGRMGESFGNVVNSRLGGASVLAASSVARYSKTYVPKGAVENQVWLVPASDTVSLCLSFTNTGNGVLTVTATYAVLDQEMRELLFENEEFPAKEIRW
ncbi:MAG: hypothetical protein ACI4FY_01125 [Acetatifactor sp.]